MRQFRIEPMLDAAFAVRAVQNYRPLREKGATIRKTIDLIIGSFCLSRGHAQLPDDRDFAPMAEHLGLRGDLIGLAMVRDKQSHFM